MKEFKELYSITEDQKNKVINGTPINLTKITWITDIITTAIITVLLVLLAILFIKYMIIVGIILVLILLLIMPFFYLVEKAELKGNVLYLRKYSKDYQLNVCDINKVGLIHIAKKRTYYKVKFNDGQALKVIWIKKRRMISRIITSDYNVKAILEFARDYYSNSSSE